MNEKTNKIYKIFFEKFFYVSSEKPEVEEINDGFFVYKFYDRKTKSIVRIPADRTTVLEGENEQ